MAHHAEMIGFGQEGECIMIGHNQQPCSTYVCVLVLSIIVGLFSGPSMAKDASQTSPASWKMSMEEAVKRFKSGDTEKAIEAARMALEQARSRTPSNTQALFEIRLGLASMLLQTGANAEAQALVQDAQAIAENAVKSAQGKVAITLKYLGALHMMDKDYPKAEKVYRQAAKLSKTIHGPNHPETAQHLGNLGTILFAQKKLKDSVRQLTWAMEIWDAQPTPDPVYTAGTMITLAQVELEQKQKKKALARYAKAIRIQESAFGPSDPRRAQARVKYIEFLRAAGETATADALELKYGQ